MRLVNATVVYTEHIAENAATYYTIENFTVRFRNAMILTLYSSAWDKIDREHPYKYMSLSEMHDTVLRWLKCHDLKTKHRESFCSKFYDILWIDSITHEVHTFAH